MWIDLSRAQSSDSATRCQPIPTSHEASSYGVNPGCARLLRLIADHLTLAAEWCATKAERLSPSVSVRIENCVFVDCELVEGLHREAIEDHNRQVARALYGPTLRVVR
jgi:hypothetical protein